LVFYSNGDGTNFEELAGSGVDGAFLDGGSNALTELNEDGVQGRFIILVRDGGIVEEDEIIVIELTDPFVNTLRDTVIGFSSQMSSDINNRLLRLRSGFNFENSDTLGSPMMGIVAESNPWLNKVSLYADINHFEYSIDSRNVFTAGGLLSTTLPETEVTGQRGLVGLEYSKNRNLSIGFASVFGIGDADHSDGSFRGDYTGYGLFGYASYRSDKINNTGLRFYGDALLGYQGGQVDTTQTSGGLRASGETEYNGLSFELNTGLIYQYGKFEHTGFLQLRGNHGQVNSYRASGVGVGLDVPEFDYDSQTLAVGYQLSTTRAYKCGNVTPFVSVSYEEELEEQDGLINGNPVASGPSDAVVFSGGIQFQPQQDMFVSFEGQHKSFDNGDSSSLGVSLGIKF